MREAVAAEKGVNVSLLPFSKPLKIWNMNW